MQSSLFDTESSSANKLLASGNLSKMNVVLNKPIDYSLRLNGENINMNSLIGTDIKLQFTGKINCANCSKSIKRTFQGFCYDCFTTSVHASECIIRPELCEAHLGKGRDPEWEEANHNQTHYVYLALSSGVKVGVTRGTQIPTRWIDQGASSAIRLAKTPNRYLSGLIEVALKESFTDKTNWQRMLKNDILTGVDLEEEKWSVEEILPQDLAQYLDEDDEIIELEYPITAYPNKVSSVSFDKVKEISGILQGIKGQYLIFESGQVINIRRHTGYEVELFV
jgi:hypothetical protein